MVVILSKLRLKQIILLRIHPTPEGSTFKGTTVCHVTVDEAKMVCGKALGWEWHSEPLALISFVRCLNWSMEGPVLMVSGPAPLYEGHRLPLVNFYLSLFIYQIISYRFIKINFHSYLFTCWSEKSTSIHYNSRNTFPVALTRKVLHSRHQPLRVDSQYW